MLVININISNNGLLMDVHNDRLWTTKNISKLAATEDVHSRAKNIEQNYRSTQTHEIWILKTTRQWPLNKQGSTNCLFNNAWRDVRPRRDAQ